MPQSTRKRTRSSAKTTVKKKAENHVGKEFSVGEMVPIESVKLPARQPRRSFDSVKMQQLIESVRKFGILEPLIVRPLSDEMFELVAGERRYRAASEIKLSKVPVVVREMTEKEAFELALLENLQRDDLNPIDETEGLLDLLCESLELSHEGVVSLLNKAANTERKGQKLTDSVTRNHIQKVDEIFLTVGRINRESFRSNRLPILNLPQDVLEFLRGGELEYTKAKAIAKIEDKRIRQKLMQEVVKKGLSLKAVKEAVSDLHSKSIRKTTPQKMLKDELKSISRIKTDAWKDEQKQQKLKTLLAEIRATLES